jgi:magnesium-transporting ATPase (P-type)
MFCSHMNHSKQDVDATCDTEEKCEKELIMVGLVGIEDPIRKSVLHFSAFHLFLSFSLLSVFLYSSLWVCNISQGIQTCMNVNLSVCLRICIHAHTQVPQAIKDAKRAGITVRMVTGDNTETAAAIAVQCGIIEEHQKDPKLGFVWEGGQFREQVNPGGKGLNQEEFDKIWENLRVMGRSTPLDKEILVNGLKNSKVGKMRQTVAVTGDGTNDAPALKRSDVGFAMGIAVLFCIHISSYFVSSYFGNILHPRTFFTSRRP